MGGGGGLGKKHVYAKTALYIYLSLKVPVILHLDDSLRI